MDKLIAEQWQSFEQQVIPKTAPAIQREEMQKAFFAGALAVLGVAFELGSEDVSEEDGAATLEGMKRECLEFMAKMGGSSRQ